MGGDHAPAAIVAGAVAAYRESGVQIILAGQPGPLSRELATHGVTVDEIPIAPAEDALGMDEGALAIRRRTRSSIAVACQLVRRGQAGAVVSAGSTGGIVATARLRLKPLGGVRPALAAVLPTRPRPTVLIDVGATADPKPEMLFQFAQLGVAYAEVTLGIQDPRVGLLTIGAEAGKGNRLARETYELLADGPVHGGWPLSFAGNIEGGDLMAGKVDVIVTDGFTGNVALKTLEGSVRFAAAQLRDTVTANRVARAGAVLQRRAFRELSERLDSETYGGAALLGLGGTVVIAHGASTARGVKSACVLARDLAQGQIVDKIRERLGPGRPGHFRRRRDQAPGPQLRGGTATITGSGGFRTADRLEAWPIRRNCSRAGSPMASPWPSARPTGTPIR
jgi:glycerol-3-phosphate acyltransferase PlsX